MGKFEEMMKIASGGGTGGGTAAASGGQSTASGQGSSKFEQMMAVASGKPMRAAGFTLPAAANVRTDPLEEARARLTRSEAAYEAAKQDVGLSGIWNRLNGGSAENRTKREIAARLGSLGTQDNSLAGRWQDFLDDWNREKEAAKERREKVKDSYKELENSRAEVSAMEDQARWQGARQSVLGVEPLLTAGSRMGASLARVLGNTKRAEELDANRAFYERKAEEERQRARQEAAVSAWEKEHGAGEAGYQAAAEAARTARESYERAQSGRRLDETGDAIYQREMEEARGLYDGMGLDEETLAELLAAEQTEAWKRYENRAANGYSPTVYADEDEMRGYAEALQEAEWVRDWAAAHRWDDVSQREDYRLMADAGEELFREYKAGDYASAEDENRYNEARREYYDQALESGMDEENARRHAEAMAEDIAREYGYNLANSSRFDPRYHTEFMEPDERWSDEEKRTFYALLAYGKAAADGEGNDGETGEQGASGGRSDDWMEAAREYGAELNRKYNAAEAMDKARDWTEYATRNIGTGLLSTIGSVGAHIAGGLPDFLRMAAEQGYRGDLYETQYEGVSRWADVSTGAIAQELNEKSGTVDEHVPLLGGKGVGDVYSLFVSMAESAASIGAGELLLGGAGLTGEAGSLAAFFGMAASGATRDALERGLDGQHAVWSGFASGLAEVLGEKFSVENLLSNNGLKDFLTKGAFREMLKQGGIEASEEAFTTMLNSFSDRLLNGGASELRAEVLVNQYNGMTQREAERAAIKDYFKRLADDAFGGFLSGSLMSGSKYAGYALPAAATTYGADTTTESSGKNQARQAAQTLFDAAAATDEGSTARKAAEKYRPGFERRGGISNLTAAKLTTAIEDSLQNAGESVREGVRKILEAGGAFGQTQEAEPTIDEESGRTVKAAGETAGLADGSTGQVLGAAYDPESGEMLLRVGTGETGQETDSHTSAAALVRNDEGETGERLVPVSRAEISEGLRKLLDTLKDVLGPEQAAPAYNLMENGQSVGDYAKAYGLVRNVFGRNGANREKARASSLAAGLTDGQFEAAYVHGQDMAKRILNGAKQGASGGRIVPLRADPETSEYTGLAMTEKDGDGQSETAAREDGGETQYSLREFADGQRYVDVDVDQEQFDGLTPNEALKKAREIIRSRFMGRVIGSENRAFVNGATANEYQHSANKRTSDEQKQAKSRVSPELDNLLDAGFNLRTAADGRDGHSHKGLSGDYKYLDAIFKIGNQYYQATINIEQTKRGDRLKDVTKVQNATERIAALAGNSPRTTSPDDVSTTSIRESSGKSKTQSTELVSFGGATVDGVRYAAVTERVDRAEVRAVQAFAEAAGIRVVFFQSEADAQGRYQGGNGFYKDGTVYLDIHAGQNRQGESLARRTLLFTMSHEVTHLIQENAPVQYEKLRRFVTEYLLEHEGERFQDLVEQKQARDPRGNLSYDAAVDEVVADASERVLINSEAVREMARTRPKLYETVRRYVKRFLDRMARHEEARVMEPVMNELRAIWDEGLREAVGGERIVPSRADPTASERTGLAMTEKAEDKIPSGQNSNTKFSERDLSATDRELLLEEARKKDAGAALKAYAKEVRRAETLEAKGEELAEQLNAAQERAGKLPTVEEALGRAEARERALKEAEEALRKAKDAYTPEREQDALYGEKYALALKAELDKAQRRRDRVAEKDRANWVALGRARALARETANLQKKLQKNGEELELAKERLAVMEAGKALQEAAEAARERWWSEDVAEGLRQNRSLREDNRRLQRTLDWYKEQARIADPEKRRVRRDDIEALAKAMLSEHGSELDRGWLEERLQEIGDYLVSGDSSTLNAGTLNRMAGELAEELLRNVYTEESDNGDLWKEIRDTVRGTRLVISEELRGDIPDFNDWRKRHKGLFNLVRDRGTAENKAAGALGVDTFYEELSSSYGEGLFPRSITAQADQLAQIEETLNELEPSEIPLYTRHQLAELTPLVRDEILDSLMSGQVREADTKLERAAKNAVAHAREERDEARKQLKQERETREALVQKRIDDLIGRQEASREKQQTMENIRKTQKRLNRFLTENSAKRHIPEGMKADLGRFLATLNTLGPFAGEERSRDYLDEMDALRQIVERQGRWLNGEGADEGWEGMLLDLPEDLAQAMQDHINRVKEKARADRTWNINKMDLRELRELDETLTILSTAVTNANILLTDPGSYREIGKLGGQAIKDLGSIRERKSVSRLRDSVSRHVLWANTTPYYFFKRMGSAGEALFQSLTKGWGKLAMNARQIQLFAASVYSAAEVKAWEKATRDFKLRVRLADQSAEQIEGGRSKETGDAEGAKKEDGRFVNRPYGERATGERSDAERIRESYNDPSGLETVTMTEAQIMNLWCLMRRGQAQGHILGAGIKIEEFENGKFRLSRDAKTYLVTIEDLDAMFDTLSDRQKEVCRALQKFMNTVGSDWGNEISLKRKGIRDFTEENYWPIRTDSNSRDARTPDADRANLFRLLNQSFTKSTVRNANNAIVVGSVFDEFANHMADIAKYNALALPMLDAMRWFNFRERGESNEAGQYTSRSVREAIESAWGKEALSYFMTLMQDLNGNSEGGRGDSFLQRIAGANKVASVGANLRVALQQPTSIVRASLLLDGRYLARGAAMKGGIKKALKYSGLANWKDDGFFDVNINRGLREKIKHADSWKDTLTEKSMILAETGDKLTWGALWNACELETREKHRDLKGEELMQKTAERFDEVIMATQVMDSTLTRSQNMRGKGLMSEFTAFMAEPTLTFNTLMDVGFAIDAETRRTDAKTAARKYAPMALKTGMTYVLSGAVTAIAQALGDLLRDDDEYAAWYQTFWENYKTDFLDNLDPTQLIPVVKDLTNILLRGERKDMMSTLTAQKLYEAAAIWTETAKLANGTLDKATATTWYGNMTTYGKVYKSLEAVSRLAGLPASAAMRDMVSVWNRTAGELNRELKLKTYDPGEEREIQYAVKDGYLSADEAAELLVERDLASKAEAARTVYAWSQDGGAYDAVKAAALAGDKNAYREAFEAMKAAGYREREIRSEVRTAIKDRYQGTDTSGGKLSKAEAITLTQTYGGMTRPDAEATVQEWTCFVVTGISYSKIKDELLDGTIGRTRAAELWRRYGGYSQEEANDKVGFALYQDEHPNTTLSQETWKGWTERVKPSGVTGESYAKLRKQADADGSGSISQAEAAALLDAEVKAGRLTRKQAEAVWSGFGSKWKKSWAEYKR